MENKRGRKPKWLTIERFEKFISNDFAHLSKRIGWQDIKLNFVLGFMGLILALLAGIIIKIFF